LSIDETTVSSSEYNWDVAGTLLTIDVEVGTIDEYLEET